MKKSIELQGISKTYRGRNFSVQALKQIDLSIEAGSYCSLVGKSGSGKSTLLKIIALLDNDYGGQYMLFGENLKDASDEQRALHRRRIGYVFQDFQLINRHTIEKNLEISSVIRLGRVDKDRINTVIHQVQMEDKLKSFPDELSGGQKQRVAIARAILGYPDLLIADEPTGAIDAENTRNILRLIEQLHAESDMTILLVTHDKDVAAHADRQIQLREGRIEDVSLPG